MPEVERQQSVLDILKDLRGTEPLKKLFWSELNYDKVNSPIPRRGWGEQAAGALVDDPLLFASGGKDFQVIHARLNSEKLLIGMERPVVSRLLQDHPYALFVFSNRSEDRWHFLNVKYDDDVQKRRVFRRITVGPEERLRTASERVSMLDLESISPDLSGLSPLDIQSRHDDAFDVEPVTQEFFREYARVFADAEAAIKGIRDDERKRLFTQRLFNRLMFVAFIQKKGWLKFDSNHDYLWALWDAHKKDEKDDKNFYLDRLKPLFFIGLNTSNDVDIIGINKGRNRGAGLASIIGQVPYLNGGLFEEDEDDKDSSITVPDKAVGAILNDLFSRFNFTVTESTPLDIEVAVDPEMLGKIFEELVTGRHESGSYYTPKPVVSFMCREALKGYLGTGTSGESKDALERFVERHEPDDLRNAETVLDALRKVKVCDPACGSGAYLLGMLHELLDLRAALFQSRKLDAKSVYDRKLEIIQTNVYGVDIDPFAVNIARLRLWLSLAVDFEGAKPEPLPNLDYKVEVGDSLRGPNPTGGLEMGFRKQLIDDFLKLKAEYLMAQHSHKKELKKQIDKLKVDLASFSGHERSLGFDWAVEFAEAFIGGGGFDVILANPPYLGFQGFMAQKEGLKKRYKTATGKFDYYVPFIERGFQCLVERGFLCYICPTNFTKRSYGKMLRQVLVSTTTIHELCDFEDNQIFDSALNYTGIFVIQKSAPAETHYIHVRKRTLASPEILIQQSVLSDAPWVFQSADSKLLIDAVRQRVPWTLEDICLGISEGIVTGQNEVFLLGVDEAQRLGLEDETIRPCIRGREVGRYLLKPNSEVVIYPYRLSDKGTRALTEAEMRKYPNTWRYLTARKSDLGGRGYFNASSKIWYELWCQRDMTQLTVEKIVVPELAESNRFSVASEDQFYGDTVCGITFKREVKEDIAFFLGLLNSKLMEFIFKRTTVPKANGFFIYKTMFMKDLPIIRINFSNSGMKAIYSDLVKLVKNVIAHQKQGVDSTELEGKIDWLVYKIYGLTEAETNTVDSSMSDIRHQLV